jgi:TctA family transporter
MILLVIATFLVFSLITANKKVKGDAAFDLWSLVHFGAGYALGALRVPMLAAIFILILYELLEVVLRAIPGNSGKNFFEFESTTNVLCDVAVGMAGYTAGRHFNPLKKRSQ